MKLKKYLENKGMRAWDLVKGLKVYGELKDVIGKILSESQTEWFMERFKGAE